MSGEFWIIVYCLRFYFIRIAFYANIDYYFFRGQLDVYMILLMIDMALESVYWLLIRVEEQF